MSSSDLSKLWTTSLNISKFVLSVIFLCYNLVESFQKKIVKNIWVGDQLIIMKVLYSSKFAQFLLALFIILMGLMEFSLDAYMVSCPFWVKNLKRTLLLVLAKKMKQYNKGLQTTAVAVLHSPDHPATARQTVSNLCPC